MRAWICCAATQGSSTAATTEALAPYLWCCARRSHFSPCCTLKQRQGNLVDDDGSQKGSGKTGENARSDLRFAAVAMKPQERTQLISNFQTGQLSIQGVQKYRALFQKSKFWRDRPTADVPWLTFSRPTYIDEAERSFGRKENWGTFACEEEQRRLLCLYEEYFGDMFALSDSYSRYATRYFFRAKELEKRWMRVVGAVGAVTNKSGIVDDEEATTSLCKLHQDMEKRRIHNIQRAKEREHRKSMRAAESDKPTTGANQEESIDDESTEDQSGVGGETRPGDASASLLAGEQAGSSVDLSQQQNAQSFSLQEGEMPFLRQVAKTNPSALGSELLNVTRQRFGQNDDVNLRPVVDPRGEEISFTPHKESAKRPPTMKRSSSIFRPLSKVTAELLPNWDAEGVFYSVVKSNASEQPRPRRLRPKLRSPKHGAVKVKWETANSMRNGGPSSHRAKETVCRAVRGEQPTVF